MHCPTLVTHARFECLLVLQPFASYGVRLTVFEEGRTRFHEAKRHVVSNALIPQGLYPVIVAGSRPAVVLSPAGNLFDLAAI